MWIVMITVVRSEKKKKDIDFFLFFFHLTASLYCHPCPPSFYCVATASKWLCRVSQWWSKTVAPLKYRTTGDDRFIGALIFLTQFRGSRFFFFFRLFYPRKMKFSLSAMWAGGQEKGRGWNRWGSSMCVFDKANWRGWRMKKGWKFRYHWMERTLRLFNYCSLFLCTFNFFFVFFLFFLFSF